MNVLLRLQEQLNVANERIAVLERAARENPDLPSIAANLDSAVRIRGKLQRQYEEAAATADDITIVGLLTAADVESKEFRMLRDGLPAISGTFELGVISEERQARLPGRYRARLVLKARLRNGSPSDEAKWHLIELASLSDIDERGKPSEPAA